jgi:hypothetical protein
MSVLSPGYKNDVHSPDQGLLLSASFSGGQVDLQCRPRCFVFASRSNHRFLPHPHDLHLHLQLHLLPLRRPRRYRLGRYRIEKRLNRYRIPTLVRTKRTSQGGEQQ